MCVSVLPVDLSVTECHQTIVLFVHVQVLNETLTQKVIKAPEQHTTLTLRRLLLPYGYNYEASCARPD